MQPRIIRSVKQSDLVVSFLNRVYLWMALGLVLTSLAAYVTGIYFQDFVQYLQNHTANPASIFKAIFFGIFIAQLALVIVLSAAINRMSPTTATLVYLFYCVSVGLTFSTILFAYSKGTIASAFCITVFSFGGLSAYGYVTKRDLGFIGTFCIMGLFGFLALMIASMFIPSLNSDSFQWMLNICGIIIFSGLTAFDTQKIKQIALNSASESEEAIKKKAIIGALMLYLDFINLFLQILRLMGRRR